MKKGLTELVFILDKSGSMSGKESDVVGGFNAMIANQKRNEGEALVSAILFSNSKNIIIDRQNICDVTPMAVSDYLVGGTTALLDTIGDTLEHMMHIHKYIRQEDVPETTIFVISTDGLENASNHFTREKIREMIEKQKAKGWVFIYTAADIDAEEEALGMGISPECYMAYSMEDFEDATEELCLDISEFRLKKKPNVREGYENRKNKK